MMININRNVFYKIKEHKLFQNIVIFVIILSAFLVGASTFKVSSNVIAIFNITDLLITLFFIVEIIIRYIAEPVKKEFFKSGWIIFDTESIHI